MDETLKELEEIKIMKNELFNKVFYGWMPDYEEYKKFMTKKEFNEIVKSAEKESNIYEEGVKI
jgi:hypothetical protein